MDSWYFMAMVSIPVMNNLQYLFMTLASTQYVAIYKVVNITRPGHWKMTTYSHYLQLYIQADKDVHIIRWLNAR